MPRYSFPLPKNRGVPSIQVEAPVVSGVQLNDLLIYSLFARFATGDGATHELGHSYDPSTNTLEVDLPEDVLEIIENVTLGPKATRFLQWLIKSSQLWELNDDDEIIPSDDKTVAITKQIGFDEIYNAGNASGVHNIDWRNGNKQMITVTGGTTLTFTAPPKPTALQLIINQTGAFSVGWPASAKWSGNSTVSSGASKTDVASFLYDGTNYYGTLAKNFA